MTPNESHGFRLTVLNPGGHDHEQSFPHDAGEPGPEHAPVNFHALAACTRGSFQRETKRAVAEETPVLLLLRIRLNWTFAGSAPVLSSSMPEMLF